VRSTGELITDPYNCESLTGMYKILVERYQRKSFVLFNNELVKVMGLSVSKYDSDHYDEPWKPLEKLENRWENKDRMAEERSVQFDDTRLFLEGSLYSIFIFR
jgi:hypothetical protein